MTQIPGKERTSRAPFNKKIRKNSKNLRKRGRTLHSALQEGILEGRRKNRKGTIKGDAEQKNREKTSR